MSDSFGARLRQRREEQNIPLRAIAEQTKIKLSLLDGLERDDLSHWPAGIFRRAYVRSYAHAIGLNPDTIVREFLEVHPDPGEAALAAALAAAGRSEGAGPASRLRSMVGSAFGFGRVRSNPAATAPVQDETPASGRVLLRDAHAPAGRTARAAAAAPEQAIATVGVREASVSSESGRDEETASAAAQSAGTASSVKERDAAPPPQAGRPPTPRLERPDLDLEALARLCTGLGQAESAEALPPLLEDAARLIGATGLILWIWDPTAELLWPALAHGYSPTVIAHLSGVPREADNATARAFRTAHVCVIPGDDRHGAALVAPVLGPGGCTGALALEFARASQPPDAVRAAATILAAFFAQFVAAAAPTRVPADEGSPEVDRRAAG